MNLRRTILVVTLVLVAGAGAVRDPAASAPGEPPGPGGQATESEGYIQTPDAVRLHYRIMGEGEPTVVVPVGFYLADALRPLAGARRLVFYDPRGRGRSDAVDTSRVSLDHQLRDLETLRRSLGIERMALIGWSGLGMEMAVYALRHPERVTRLVQVTPVAPRRDPYMDRLIANRLARIDTGAVRRLQKRWAAGAFEGGAEDYCRARTRLTSAANFSDPEDARRAPDVCAYENEWPSNLGPYFGALLGSFGAYDWRPGLSELETPRLVIHGDDDTIPLEGTLEWVAGRPNARLLRIPDAGHWPFLERPDVFFPAVDRFLTGEWPEGARRVEAWEPQARG